MTAWIIDLRQRLMRYGLGGLRSDLLAGLTVAAVSIPQAMAYALIAGVEPRYGLYTAIIMTALGSLFGSSSRLINGPTNAISLVVFSGLAALKLTDPGDILPAIFLLTIMVGALQVLIACLKLGDLTRYISESVILGFMVGAGLLVALSQIPSLLGLPAAGKDEGHLLLRLHATFTQDQPINSTAILLGVVAILLAACLRFAGNRLDKPVPDLLLALVLTSLGAWLLGWEESWPDFPAGLPSFTLWRPKADWIRPLSGNALAIALLGLLEALAIAKSMASKTREALDCNRQCLAEGLANLGGAFFQCIPGSGSLTRSAINFQAGAVSRLSGIISALAVAITVVLFSHLFRFVPRPALAGLLMVTAYRLIDFGRLAWCFRAPGQDGAIAIATAATAVVVGVEFSIFIGVLLSFACFVPRASRLLRTELILSKERVVRERRADDPVCDKLVILGLEGELFFGAAPELEQYLNDLTVRAEAGARVIVLRLKRTRNPDMVCLERLQYFLQEMQARGVVVLLCGVREDFAAALRRLEFSRWLPAENVYLEDAPSENGDLALSSTLLAVKRAYDLLGDNVCASCPRRQEIEIERGWYYMI